MNDFRKFLETEGLKSYDPFSERLYKYVCFDTAKKIITNCSLKFSSASDFNDPFELTLDCYDFEMDKKQMKSLIKRAHPGSRSDKTRFYINHKKNKYKAISAVRTGLENLRDTIGICCFSSNFNKTLMWSHYANNHTGVCLGFQGIMPNDEFFILHMRYMDQIKKFNYWKTRERSFPLWVFTKSHVWQYEEEIRAVYVQKKGLLGFEKDCLTSVHFGVRTPQKDIDELNLILQESGYGDVAQYRMRMNPNTFDIIHEPILK